MDGNLSQHHRHVSALAEDGDAEAGLVAEGKPEVGTAGFLKFLLAAVRRDAFHQAHRVGGFEHFGLELLHVTMQSEHRWLAHRDVQIARSLLDLRGEQFVD